MFVADPRAVPLSAVVLLLWLKKSCILVCSLARFISIKCSKRLLNMCKHDLRSVLPFACSKYNSIFERADKASNLETGGGDSPQSSMSESMSESLPSAASGVALVELTDAKISCVEGGAHVARSLSQSQHSSMEMFSSLYNLDNSSSTTAGSRSVSSTTGGSPGSSLS